MDVIEAIRTRRSTKSFSATPVPAQMLSDLVDAASYSPSGVNKNPWHFVLITEHSTLERLSQAQPHCHWLASAQAGIALVVDPSYSRYWLEDCCVAAYSIWLAATGLGLGVAWGAMYQSDNAEESERRQGFVREILSVPDGLNIPMVLAIGYPQGTPPERKRPATEEIIHWERYTIKDAR